MNAGSDCETVATGNADLYFLSSFKAFNMADLRYAFISGINIGNSDCTVSALAVLKSLPDLYLLT